MTARIGSALAALVVGLALLVTSGVWMVAPIPASGGGTCGTVLKVVDDGNELLSTSGCSSSVSGYRVQTITVGLLGLVSVIVGAKFMNIATDTEDEDD